MKLSFPGYCYSIDTSALIDLKPYFPDIFTSLWKNLENLISQERLFAPREVFEELKKKDDELFKWAKGHRRMFKDLDNAQMEQMRNILRDFPNFVDMNKTTPEADPFVIALAISEGCTVIASEKPVNLDVNPDACPRIPDVCKKRNVKCITLEEFFREQKWEF